MQPCQNPRMAPANELRQAIKRRFYPFAEGAGFVRAKSTHPHFTTFRRHRTGVLHVFDVQWDKYHRPRFVLNFGEAPGGDLELHGLRVAAADIEPVHCEPSGRLQRRRGGSMSCWFQLRKPLFEILTTRSARYPPDEVVDQLIQAFGEVEEWWRTKHEGQHIYRPR